MATMSGPAHGRGVLLHHLGQGLDPGQETEPIHAETDCVHRVCQRRNRKRGGKGFRATGTTDILSHGVVLPSWVCSTRSLTAPGERHLPQLFNIDRDISFGRPERTDPGRSPEALASFADSWCASSSLPSGRTALLGQIFSEATTTLKVRLFLSQCGSRNSCRQPRDPPKMTLDGEAQQLYPHSWRILSLWESATRYRQDTPPSIHRVTNFRV